MQVLFHSEIIQLCIKINKSGFQDGFRLDKRFVQLTDKIRMHPTAFYNWIIDFLELIFWFYRCLKLFCIENERFFDLFSFFSLFIDY